MQFEGWFIRGVLIFLFVEIVLAMIFLEPDTLADLFKAEQSSHVTWLGPQLEQEIETATANATETVVRAASLREYMNEAETAAGDQDLVESAGELAGRFNRFLQSRLDTLEMALYLIFYRFNAVLIWYPAFLTLFMATALDGFIKREIAKWRFSYTSNLMHRAMTTLFFTVMIYLLVVHPMLPFVIPPWLAPMVITVQALGIWGWITNTQKRI